MLTAEKGAADNTINAYKSDITEFANSIQKYNVGLKNAESQNVREFISTLSGLNPSSQARKLSAVRQFYQFLLNEGIREDDPTAVVESPKTTRPIPKTISQEEVEKLLQLAEEETNRNKSNAQKIRATRMHLLIELLYATGLRVSELISLPNSIRTDAEFLVVTGKGNKERMVPISKKAMEALKKYKKALEDKKKKSGESKWLFESTNGCLTRQHFARELKALANKAGINNVSPHTLRHAFASHLLQNGADLRSVQQLLGHADIATTEIYTHVLEEHLKKLVHTAHPLAQNPDQDETE